jgi:aminoglycoside phosphotransferase (APT) family kinase protein
MPSGTPQSTHNLPQRVLCWIADALAPGAAVQSVCRLAGATSSTLFKVDIKCRGRPIDLVLRLFTNREWLAEEPDIARHEMTNLQQAARAGVPTPEGIAYDAHGETCGVPAILMTRLPGAVDLLPPDLDGWLYGMAEALIPIHTLKMDAYPWSYAPYNDVTRLKPPAWSSRPELWAKAIAIVNGPWPRAPMRFIHRDYHPTNVLWQDGRLSGIVDWPNACLGPAGIDVAWCRSNLVSMHGIAAADRFLHAYQSLVGASFAYHPFWDLMVIIESLPGPPGVYPPWVTFGMRGLTGAILQDRLDAYLVSVLAHC